MSFAEIVFVPVWLMLTVVVVTFNSVPATLVIPFPSFATSELLVRVIPVLSRTILLSSDVL